MDITHKEREIYVFSFNKIIEICICQLKVMTCVQDFDQLGKTV